MFERTGGYYLPLALGASVTFARGIAQLAEDLATQRPTAVFPVPRVFEKFAERIRAAVAGAWWKRALLERCVATGCRLELGGAGVLNRVLAPALHALVVRPILARVQDDLFSIGADLALPPGMDRVRWTVPATTHEDLQVLEREIDRCEKDLPALQRFILPGGGSAGALWR